MPKAKPIEETRAFQDEDVRNSIRKLRLRGITSVSEISRLISRDRTFTAKQLKIIRKQDVQALGKESRESMAMLAKERLEKELSIHSELQARLFNKAITDPEADPAKQDKNYVNPKVVGAVLGSGEHLRNILKDLAELQGLLKDTGPAASGAPQNNGIMINVSGASIALNDVREMLYQLLPNSEVPILPDTTERDSPPTVIEAAAKKEEP